MWNMGYLGDTDKYWYHLTGIEVIPGGAYVTQEGSKVILNINGLQKSALMRHWLLMLLITYRVM